MAKKQITIRIHRATNGEHYFTINGGNGKVIMTSETYKRRQGVNRAIDTLRDGWSYFLKVCDSEGYPLEKGQKIIEDTPILPNGRKEIFTPLRDRGLM